MQNVPSEQQGPRADPRQIMWEIYLGMRRRGELALKAVPAPKGQPPAPAPEPEPAVEDDADGVADGVLDPLDVR